MGEGTPDRSRGYVALASADKATLRIQVRTRRTIALYVLSSVVEEALAQTGYPTYRDRATYGTGKRLLRGSLGRIEVLPAGRAAYEIRATPDPEFLVPSLAGTIQAQHGHLEHVAEALQAERLVRSRPPVTLYSITPLVDVASCSFTCRDVDLPGLTTRVADRHVDPAAQLTSLLAFGVRAYNKSLQAGNDTSAAWILDLYDQLGIPAGHHPIWRVEADVGTRQVARSPWPPDLGALHRGTVARFLRLGLGLPAGHPRVAALMSVPPWSVVLSARFPPLDVPAGPPTILGRVLSDRRIQARGYLPYILSELLPAQGLSASSLSQALHELADAPGLVEAQLEERFLTLLALSRQRYSFVTRT